ncbi:hypothetical protein ALP41_00352 [Pseudomonas savastanoi pv. nerii]|nr:hypothetical protein ALP41_00352 [Pseudomonas savastanoi pv. nerii]
MPELNQFGTVFIQRLGQVNLATGAIQPGHTPELELKVVPLGLSHVVQLVFIRVERTRRDLVQQRFPDMRQVGVDQRDTGRAFLAQGFTQAGRQLQTACAAANDNNTMRHKDYSEGLRNSRGA